MSSADWRSRLEGLLAEHRREQAAESAKPDRIDAARAWHAKLVDSALAAPGWPKSVGGLELSLEDQLDYYRITSPPPESHRPRGPRRTRAHCRSSSRPR